MGHVKGVAGLGLVCAIWACPALCLLRPSFCAVSYVRFCIRPAYWPASIMNALLLIPFARGARPSPFTAGPGPTGHSRLAQARLATAANCQDLSLCQALPPPPQGPSSPVACRQLPRGAEPVPAPPQGPSSPVA
eukprot:38698-Chlamydomonas_euryale.AAC.3